MMQPAVRSTPRPRDVQLEQLRVVGLSLRRPALAAAVLVALLTLLLTVRLLDAGGSIDFHPEYQYLPGMLGLLLPVGVWRGEERFGAGFLWTLPVDRRRHALARVFAGWAWLMSAVLVFVLWLLALTLLSGGSVRPEETIHVLHSSSPLPDALDAAAVETVRWTPHPLLWLVPFTAATGTYLLASALALGTRHPLRWIVGTVLGLSLVFVAGDVGKVQWLADAPVRLLRPLFAGPYGLDTLLSARTESVQVGVTLATGERVMAWRALPDLGQWGTATLLWTGAGLAALWAAASRHREDRSA